MPPTGTVFADALGVLLTWFKVLLACAVVLVIAFLAFAQLARNRAPKGAFRTLAGVGLIAAFGTSALAWRAWAAYSDVMNLANILSFPHPPQVQETYEQRAQEAAAFYTTAGWIAAAVTAGVLVAGVFAMTKAKHTT